MGRQRFPTTITTSPQPPTKAGLVQRGPRELDFSSLLQQFQPIGLDHLSQVALLDRTDTKYVLHADQLYHALSTLTSEYWVLDIGGTRLNTYQSLYFDTADFALYRRHHAGTQNRYKVRSRKYVDTNLSFVEVKFKTNKDRTLKNRLKTPTFITNFTPEVTHFLKGHLPCAPHELGPKLWNDYVRITLVNKQHPERLTLDLNLQFYVDQQHITLPGVAVAEVKQGNRSQCSPFMELMREGRIHPMGFSKYCIGVSFLYPQVKHNNFKSKHRMLARLTGGAPYAAC